MRRRLLVTIGVLSASLAVAGGASAYAGDPMTLPENQAIVQATLKNLDVVPTVDPSWINPATGSPYTQADREAGVARAQTRMGARRALPALGILALGGSALYTGWEIGTPLGSYIRQKISGDPGATITGATIPKWYSWCPTGTAGPAGGNCSFVDLLGSQVIMCGGVAMTGNCVPIRGWLLSPSTSGPVRVCEVPVTNGCVGDGCTGCQAWANSIVAQGNVSKIYNSAYGSANTCAPNAIPANVCYYVYRTNAQMEAAVKLEACNVACIATATNTINDKAREVVDTPTAAAMNDAETVCGGYLGVTAGSASVEACRAAINSVVDPTWRPGDAPKGPTVSIPSPVTVTIPGTISTTTFAPFVLPRPDVGETWPDYAERLRTKGWLGTITLVDDAVTYPGGSPGALATAATVTGLKVGAGTTIDLYHQTTGAAVTWPTNPPNVPTTTTAIEIRKLPGSPPAPGAPGDLDFGPLNDLDPGCSFPYGFVCYATDVTGWFNVTPTAPAFEFTTHPVDVLGTEYGGGAEYNVTLDFFSDYMAIIRTILSVCMWIGAVYYLATRLLGFKAGGDPGEAYDDAAPF